jgi:hypothetical protein
MKVNIKYNKVEEKESIVKGVLQIGGVIATTMALSCGFVAFQLICNQNNLPIDQVAFKIISSGL